MPYADLTINDRNPVKRWLQRRRISDAIKLMKNDRNIDRPRVLDFGAGDGELVRQMAGIADIDASVYEPTPALMAEARKKLAGLDSVVFLESLDSVGSEIFDYVFCLEVFEHLPKKETAQAISEINRVLKADGFAVIGVPHELFFPAMLKGIFRMCRRYGAYDASPRNILAAICGRPPSRRPTEYIAPGVPYHLQHLGFDYRILERSFLRQFNLTKKQFSPFPGLGAALNSEVYYLLEKSSTARRRQFHPCGFE